MHPTDTQVRAAIDALLGQRDPAATICPSEAARALEPGNWRPLMSQVRAVARLMAQEGVLEIRQHGCTVAPDGPLRGPIRLGRVTGGKSRSPGPSGVR